MNADIFDDAKRLVTVLEAAEFYGFHPNRSGFIVCPFHSEHTASLHLKERSWRCFGCNEGGTVIDFTCKLFKLFPLDAVKKLNDDFRLGLDLDRPPDRQETQTREAVNGAYVQFEAWRIDILRQLNDALRLAWLARDKAPDDLTVVEAEAIRWREPIEDWADALGTDDMDVQMKIFRWREAVAWRLKQIFSNTPQKSQTA